MKETLVFPSTFSEEENHLKELFDIYRSLRRNSGDSPRRVSVSVAPSEVPTTPKGDKLVLKRLSSTQETTEEVRKKFASGAIKVKTHSEQRFSFKRTRVAGRSESGGPSVDDDDEGEILDLNSPPPASSANFWTENKGPTVYIRGYDLQQDALNSVFSKFGKITRTNVDARQKSAFIAFENTSQAETAIDEMDGNMVNGITIRVSFARRQSQGGPDRTTAVSLGSAIEAASQRRPRPRPAAKAKKDEKGEFVEGPIDWNAPPEGAPTPPGSTSSSGGRNLVSYADQDD